ncbi:MAG: DUF4834 family protein [Flavobacteriales bacterium]|jgi:hypothetical protein|nr:DUF4834 family protein [Flavobacteriales bacterium]
MIGLFRFFFWFFLISYILRILGRYIFPILLKRYINKKQSQFNQQFNQQDSPIEKEGKVSVKTKPKKSKTDTNDMGEYVDFEEVDD